MQRSVRLALAGNPNCGKTTMFNAITGSRQHVGNYPGVTVERKEGQAQVGDVRLDVVDLPGCYSLTAYTMDEIVARAVLVDERPDVVVNVLDATVLERSLYLTVQFLELGIPLVLSLNMMDEVEKAGLRIDAKLLSRLLGIPVVETVGRAGRGKDALLSSAVAWAGERAGRWAPLRISYGPDIDVKLDLLAARIEAAKFLTDRYPARWTALKYVESDPQVLEAGRAASPALAAELEAEVGVLAAHTRATLGVDPDALVADYRYGFIAGVLKQGVLSRDTLKERIDVTDRMDRVLTHRVAGPAIMLGVLYAMFWLTFTAGEVPMGWVEAFFGWLGETATALIPEGPLQSLVVSGVIDGVGGVMGFVPLILIMFLLISFLEDLGYMARVAYMLDRVLRIFGLHGCSVMPFVISGGIAGGCAVPGIMATRTLRSPKEKLATLLTAPFMTCGAKIPVFVLLTAAFFAEDQARVMFLITLGGWTAALLVSRLLRWTVLRGESVPFVMELPPYRLPTLRGVTTHALERTWQYIKKAGTVILAVSILLWAAMTYPGLPEDQAAPYAERIAAAEAAGDEAGATEIGNELAQAELRASFAGMLGTAIEPASRLAGFDWRTNIALLGGVAAKEIVVSTLGTAYSLGEVSDDDTASLSERLAADPTWTIPGVVALIAFVLLYSPCFVTIVTMAKESSWGWAAFAMTFNTALAFGVAVGIYQLGTLLG